jgi:hypothetical protein
MADTPEQISTGLARELVRDGDTERLIGDSRAIDELNQSVIKEFRANQGKVGGPMEGMRVLSRVSRECGCERGIFAGTNNYIAEIGGRPPMTVEELLNKNREAFV